MNNCGNHKGMIVMHAFSDGECDKCGCEVVTGHIPCDKVCPNCSEQYDLCHICGDYAPHSFEVNYCETCIQMTNHLGDVCQKCK